MSADTRMLTFDVFGTVVDWHSSVSHDGRRLAVGWGLPEVDWDAFATAWRGRYGPSMAPIRDGAREWTRLDVLHRENLIATLAEFGLDGLDGDQINDLNRAWHRLDPWPDSVAGLARLKTRFILAGLSNGNIELIVNMAKHAGLLWDVVLGAEPTRQYKPHPDVYRKSAEIMGLAPAECMMVAAHPADLDAAAAVGFRTAYIHRPLERGPARTGPMPATDRFDLAVSSLEDLAAELNC